MKKQIMKRAWEIAKQGQNKFGGKVSEYLSAALKMAWEESRKVTLTTTPGSRKHKSWIAEIAGTHPKWKLDRKFIDAVDENMMDKTFELENGKVYEVCDAGDREFIQVANGEIEYLEYAEVTAMVA